MAKGRGEEKEKEGKRRWRLGVAEKEGRRKAGLGSLRDGERGHQRQARKDKAARRRMSRHPLARESGCAGWGMAAEGTGEGGGMQPSQGWSEGVGSVCSVSSFPCRTFRISLCFHFNHSSSSQARFKERLVDGCGSHPFTLRPPCFRCPQHGVPMHQSVAALACGPGRPLCRTGRARCSRRLGGGRGGASNGTMLRRHGAFCDC